MRIRVLMITHNRAQYTGMALERLCETLPDDACLTIWDNASNAETQDVVRKFESHPRVERVVFHRRNDKLRGPTNWFWQSAGEAEFLSKVDDDGLMPEKWVQTLIQAHKDIPETGVLGTWRFPDEDFVQSLADKKIQTFGTHKILRNCWVEGSGYLMKTSVVEQIGLIGEKESFTTYCTRAAAAGFINGWYFPFLYQEHMDDPRAAHTGIKTEEDFKRLKPLTAGTFDVHTRGDWIALNKHFARSLQSCSFDPDDYIGWKAWMRRKLCRLVNKPYVPLAT